MPRFVAAPALFVAALALGGCGGGSSMTVSSPGTASAATSTTTKPPATHPPFAVGERTVTFVDRSRTVAIPGRGREPRTLVTVVRYPLHARGPFPLVVFGHGFAVTPHPYAALLTAWARAGFIVAAPIFPLENAHAPGGPNESDLINQPRDMSFVITRMLRASATAHGFLAGLIDPRRIAVAGQSDGGETALAVAYDRHFIDRRVSAAVILSGAQIPGVGGLHFPSPSPPLLATQGTADTINQPRFTTMFFRLAPRPKFLLKLLGAGHLPPYTTEEPQLGIVERVSIAFLDRYLIGRRAAVGHMRAAGDVPGLATLVARP